MANAKKPARGLLKALPRFPLRQLLCKTLDLTGLIWGMAGLRFRAFVTSLGIWGVGCFTGLSLRRSRIWGSWAKLRKSSSVTETLKPQARSVGLQLSLELPLGLPKALAFCHPLKSSLEVVPSNGIPGVHGQGL